MKRVGTMRISTNTNLAASVVAVMVGALLLAACSTSAPRTNDSSALHANRHVHYVTGDYSAFRYGHHGYGAHGLRRHLHRWHRFH